MRSKKIDRFLIYKKMLGERNLKGYTHVLWGHIIQHSNIYVMRAKVILMLQIIELMQKLSIPVPKFQCQSVLIQNNFKEIFDFVLIQKDFREKLRENILYSSESEDNSEWLARLSLNRKNSAQNVTWYRLWLSTEFDLELGTGSFWRFSVVRLFHLWSQTMWQSIIWFFPPFCLILRENLLLTMNFYLSNERSLNSHQYSFFIVWNLYLYKWNFLLWNLDEKNLTFWKIFVLLSK